MSLTRSWRIWVSPWILPAACCWASCDSTPSEIMLDRFAIAARGVASSWATMEVKSRFRSASCWSCLALLLVRQQRCMLQAQVAKLQDPAGNQDDGQAEPEHAGGCQDQEVYIDGQNSE